MIRLTDLLAFTKAVELGSFSAAADALDLSPQMVGKHVQLLEKHLGLRLLYRNTRRQQLTDAGRNFYDRSKTILAEVEAAEALAAEARNEPSGLLRINAPVTFGIHALSPRLPEYLRENPRVSVDLAITNRRVELLEEGFDVIFRVGDIGDSSLVAQRLAPYRLVLCAAPAYLSAHKRITAPGDLVGHECLVFKHPTLQTRWTFTGPGGPINVAVKGRMTADSGEALLSMARAGMGLLFQPLELVAADLKAGHLVKVMPRYPAPSRPFHLLYPQDRIITPKLRSFLDFAKRAFGPSRT
ncbi:MAG: hypothetical protein RLZZ200_1086 [Pseudomonadota bacterium]|jgi:DNA-binding transcriptional LysR family regulator